MLGVLVNGPSGRFPVPKAGNRALIESRLPSQRHNRRAFTSVRVAATSNSAKSTNAVQEPNAMPTVKIDNSTDSFATIVKIDFGDRLGELLDTIRGLRNLGYNITRAKLSGDSRNKFFITDAKTGEKVTKSAELEAIRQSILQTMMEYHPEAQPLLATGAPSENPISVPPLGAQFHEEVDTSIKLSTPPDSPYTRLEVTTTDRPGLLVDIVRTLKDCNIHVVSAEVDTIGICAKDEFIVSYHGGPLSSSMKTLVRNALGYYLALAEIETAESY